jgi:hypothetical protein
MSERNDESSKKGMAYFLSLAAVLVGILGGLFGIAGGVMGIIAYFQTERLAEDNAALSSRLAEDANTYIALQTRVASCNEIAAHHSRQAEEDREAGYVETKQVRLPDGSTETLSSNQQRFIASIIMSRALSMCLVEGGNQGLVRECISNANSGGFGEYPRHIIDAVDDKGNGFQNLAC